MGWCSMRGSSRWQNLPKATEPRRSRKDSDVAPGYNTGSGSPLIVITKKSPSPRLQLTLLLQTPQPAGTGCLELLGTTTTVGWKR